MQMEMDTWWRQRKEGLCFSRSYLVSRGVREEQDKAGKPMRKCSETGNRHPNAPTLTSNRRGT